VEGAVTRYRILAFIVGTLLVLLAIGMVLKYGPTDMPEMAGIVSPIHGLFYMVYVALAFDLWRRTGWPIGKMALIVLGGVVPLMTFFVERKIVREARALPAAEAKAGAGV
jgi:integral membrane protein